MLIYLALRDPFDGQDDDEEEDGEEEEASGCAGPDAVIPSKDGQLIQSRDEVPASCDVSSNEDA